MSSLSLAPSVPNNIVRLSGRTLAIARALWLAVFALTTLTFLIALPYRWTTWGHPSPTNLANLTALGIAPAMIATYLVFWEIAVAVPYLVVGLIIFWRCGEERMALLASFFLVVFGVGSGTLTPTLRSLLGIHPALDLLQHSFEFISWLSFGLFFYLFPNGRYDLMSEEQPTAQSFFYMIVQWPLDLIMATLPISIAFSVLRYRLWDMDQLISRTVVYGTLTAFVLGTYVLVVGGLSMVFQLNGNPILSLIATGIIALFFNPVRERLQRIINRLLYGERADPYAVLSRLSQNLEATLAPDSVLSSIVETVAQTLKLPYAAIVLRDGDSIRVAASFGSKSRALALPLIYQHQFIGELHVATRSSDEPFTAAERRLFDDIAAQTAIVVHNVKLAADLQRSREQIVAAREEERRRLRRDLHDGLGPKLAGQTLKLEAALDSLDGETETARELLRETMTESRTVISEIRRLVYGLRPPALDQFGLLTAVRELVAQSEYKGLEITMRAPDTLPALPAAVEVAAYRIIQEALTNVVRHARAKTCTVSLTLANHMEIEICDDGVGLTPHQRAGVGLASMRERAEEIGGQWVIERGAQGGTRVFAQLPLNSASVR